MVRFLLSLIVALVIGLGIGFYIGWVQFPVRFTDSPPSALDQRYKDDYTVMVASAYLVDSDLTAALERLRFLQVANVPAHVQEVTERYITASRDVNDIRRLVALSEGLGRLTPIMEPYRFVNVPGQP